MSRRELRHRPLDIEIIVTDVSEQQRQVNDTLNGSGYRANVYRRGEWPIRDGWRCSMDTFEDRLRICKLIGEGINSELVHFLAREVCKAHSSLKTDDKGEPIYVLGGVCHTLHRSGCRAYFTHVDFAKKYGYKSRSNVTEQINLLKQWGFIVSSGQGWVEFDCCLVWRGDIKILAAYAPIQEIDNPEQHRIANDFFQSWREAEREED